MQDIRVLKLYFRLVVTTITRIKQAEGYRHLAFLLVIIITRKSVFYLEFFETENTQTNNTNNTHTRTHNEEKMKTANKASIFNT